MSDVKPPQDTDVLRILRERDGVASSVALDDGRTLTVYDIAWGYDMGDTYAHVTTNISPGAEEHSIDFFHTDRVSSILDPATGAALFEAERP